MLQIAQKQLDRVNRILESSEGEHDSFLNGKLGLVYYYFHLYVVTKEPRYRDRGRELLDSVFSHLNSGYPRLIGTSFSSGGAGLGYVMNYLGKKGLIEFSIDTEFETFDNFLFNTALQQIEEDFIDYLHGAMGVVHYFSEREGCPIVDQYLDKLIDKICSRAIKSDAGYWFRNYVLKLEDKENINFGLSHGLSGILLILLNVYERNGNKDMIRKVIMEGIRFIRKYKMDVDFSNDEYSFFPFIVRQGADEITAPNRLGWCYGDLNEVLLFYRAGNLFDDPELIDLADVIGTQTLMRKLPEATLVENSCFCHGAAGLAQFYHQLYQERNLPAYKDGYAYWIEQTLIFLDEDLDNGFYFGKEHDMLNGLIGVAFPLLSFVAGQELEWSKFLLL